MTAGPARVLVLDDHAAGDSLFRESFGEGLTVCASVRALEREIAGGRTWDVAFVDFALTSLAEAGDDHRTGLSGLLILRARRPRTKIVSYTQPGESGRQLYMAAARQWFSADATQAKSGMTAGYVVDFVERLRAGHDPSNVRLIRWLRHCDVVDQLLKTPDYVELWRAWLQFNGNEDAISRRTHMSPAQIRTFKATAADAVVRFKRAFEGVELDGTMGSSGYVNFKGILSTFASENRLFFAAPDLADAVRARPRSAGRQG